VPSHEPPPSFDLTRRRWLPVQRLDGAEDELSLVEVFARAGELRRLVGDVPTQDFALLRLLLAILHDVIDGPRDLHEWERLWDGGLPVDDIAAYLGAHQDRFDLLHPRTPFLQTPGMHTANDETGSLDRLVADVPNGELFFTMRAAGVERLGFAEAARWVVHAHAFDTSGIKTGAVGDPRVKGGRGYPQGVAWAGNLGGVFVEGTSLRETLLLNLIAFDTDNLRIDPGQDRPAWRRDPTTAAPTDQLELTRRPSGLRDLYTWQSRRIRLHFDTGGVDGVVLAYGDPLTARNQHRREPMTAWRRSPPQERKLSLAQVYLPREHDPSRSVWRGLGALIAGRAEGAEQRNEAAAIVRPRILDWVARLTIEGPLPPDFLIRPRLIGARYGTQQSVIDEIIDDAVAMPVVLLHERDNRLGQAAIDAVADAENAVTALGNLAADLAKASGSETDPARAATRNLGFGMLDGPFRQWLAALRAHDDPAERRTAWQTQTQKIVSRLGHELTAAAGDAAWQGRVVETRAERKLWLNAGRADLTFRAQLSQALPAAEPSPNDRRAKRRTEPIPETQT
jgi:CRISPR system Cascade subunit CasA